MMFLSHSDHIILHFHDKPHPHFKMKGMADLEWIVSGFPFSDRIQEAHMAAIHIIIERVESQLFETANSSLGTAAH